MRLIGVLLALSLSACATNSQTTGSEVGEVSAGSGDLGRLQNELSDTRARNSDLETELETRESRISSLESQIASLSSASTPVQGSSELFPPNARPGECYARILIPEEYKTSTERVLAKQASERVEIIPARFESVSERVLVKEESKRLEVVPAQYEEVTERVLVRPASTEIVEVAATYKTVTERVLDKPAYTVWKKGPPSQFGNSVVSQSVNGTGEVMCLVEVPATYKTISKRVVDTPARTETRQIPAEYKTVTRTVMTQGPTTREVVIPAEYETVSVRKLVSAAQERRIEIPEEYQNVTRTEKIRDAEMAWQSVLCQVNATPEAVRALQAALDKAGYNPGGMDGVLGRNTLNAVASFAKDRNIPFGENYVPLDVLKALELNI